MAKWIKPKPMTLEQAAMQLAHYMMDDPGATLRGFTDQAYATRIANAMIAATGTGWTVLGNAYPYSVHPFERMDDVRSILEAKMRGN